ncbi:MAG TPA: 50S ribosomal protein L28 [Planctomycetaceae bacterium]
MSTLTKKKRQERAKKIALYGDLKPGRGNQKVQSGKPKYLGGNGRKTRGISKRLYKRNLQSVRVMEDGRVVRRMVPVKLLRSGLVEKAVVRKPFTIEANEG